MENVQPVSLSVSCHLEGVSNRMCMQPCQRNFVQKPIIVITRNIMYIHLPIGILCLFWPYRGIHVNPPNEIPSTETPIKELAALFVGSFSIDWIQELTGHKASTVLLALEESVQKGWLLRESPGCFHFADSDSRQQALTGLGEDERQHYHRQIADLLQSQAQDGNREHAELAHHLMAMEPDLSNCEKLLETGQALYRGLQHQTALQCFHFLIETLDTGEPNDVADRLYADAVYCYCRLFTGQQDSAWIVAAIEAALARAQHLPVYPRTALLLLHKSFYEFWTGDQSRAFKSFEAGWQMVENQDDPTIQRQAMHLRMFFLWQRGQIRDVVQAYEAIRPNVARYPRTGTPILVTTMLGNCYVWLGQVSVGIGLLNSQYEQCREVGDSLGMVQVAYGLARSLIDIGQPGQAIAVIEKTLKESHSVPMPFLEDSIHWILAFAHAAAGDLPRSIEQLKLVRESPAGGYGGNVGYLITFLQALDDGPLPEEIRREIAQFLAQPKETTNVQAPGYVHLLQALIMRREGQPLAAIDEQLTLARECFERSGYLIDHAKTQLLLARIRLQMGKGNDDSTRNLVAQASAFLEPIHPEWIPDDLRVLQDGHQEPPSLLESTIMLSQEILGIMDFRELARRILTTINRLTGAERGALFTARDYPTNQDLDLKATVVLTRDDAEAKYFADAWTIIQRVAETGIAEFVDFTDTREHQIGDLDMRQRIRSCFCLPLQIRGQLIGVLYHDNCLLPCQADAGSLGDLSHFAAMAAITLDNAEAYEKIDSLNQRLSKEKDYFIEQVNQIGPYEDFIGTSPAIRKVFAQIQRVAESASTVLVLGETGAGKEQVAWAIHHASTRREGPFIRVDCNSLSEYLISSEMFGHEKGAFTGALKRHIGRFELADRGTIFLDEIGNLPMNIQTALLRILDTHEFQRVGGTTTIRSDFRLITATNVNLEEKVREGSFREDLFYRLNVYPITVPPLRDRPEDISLLAHYFLTKFGGNAVKPIDRIDESTLAKLIEYPWPGNVRELKNVIERGALLSTAPYLRLPDLQPNGEALAELSTENMTLKALERHHIMRTLERTHGKIQGPGGAAECLGLHGNTLRSRMKKLGIVRAMALIEDRSIITVNGSTE